MFKLLVRMWQISSITGLLLAVVTPAWSLPIARLRHIKPTVEVGIRVATGAVRWKTAREKMPLAFGQAIRVRDGGRVSVLFNNGTELLVQNATIWLERPEVKSEPMIIRVVGALSDVFIKARHTIKIRTTAGIAANRGTQYLLFLPTEDSMRVTVVEGLVDLSNPLGAVTIAANQQSEAGVNHAPTPPVAVDASGLIGWTAEVAGLPLTVRLPYSTASRKALLARQAQMEAAGQNRNVAEWGEVAYDLGENRDATTAFEAALTVDPNNQALRGKLGLAQLAGGAVPAALTTLTPTAAPAEPRARAALALAQAASGNQPAALATLKGVQDPWGLTVLGQIQLNGGQSDAAIPTLRQALMAAGEVAPAQAEARALLALALLENNQLTAARQTADQAVQQAPGLSLTQAVGSMTAFFANDNHRALSRARAALDEDPFSPLALVAYSRAMAREGDLDEAREAAAQAAALAPDAPRLQQEVADLNLLLDQPKAAEAAYRRVLAAQPDSVAAHSGLGAALDAEGRRTEALQEHQTALKLDPGNSLARGRLAAHYLEIGQLAEAKPLVSQGLGNTPEDGQLYIRLSELLLYRQDLIGAQQSARQAVRLLPGSALALYQLGRVYLEQGRTVQAQIAFRQALVLNPHYAEARFGLGVTRERLETGFSAVPGLSAGAITIGSPRTARDIQNLATPGAADRIQAAIENPSVIRTVTRSVGNTEISGLIGGDDTSQLGISHLQELNHRTGVAGVTAERFRTDGPGPNTGILNDHVGVTYGARNQDRNQAFLLQAEYENNRLGQNLGLPGIGTSGLLNSHEPSFLAGFSFRDGTRALTRILIQSKLRGETQDQFTNLTTFDRNDRSTDFDIRYDRTISSRHRLTLGGTYGSARVTTHSASPGPPFGILSESRREIWPAQAYIRDEMQVNRKLSLTGELRWLRSRFDLDQTTSILLPPPIGPIVIPLAFRPEHNNHVLPEVVVAYQTTPRTQWRLRARKFRTVPTQFSLLDPQDDFLLSFQDLPMMQSFVPGNGWGYGSSYEVEWNHTTKNAALWKVALFSQSIHNATALGNSLTVYDRVRSEGLRVSHELMLSPAMSWFTHLNMTRSKGSALDTSVFPTGILPEADTENVPQYAVNTGLQYLNPQGWLAQAVLYYQGHYVSAGIPPSEAGGFGVTSLRLGKRSGLERVVFVEVNNVLDRTYTLFGLPQPGRQLRAGVEQRF